MADPLTYAQLLEKEKDLRSILDSNDVEDHTIEYEDGTEEPYLKHLQMMK